METINKTKEQTKLEENRKEQPKTLPMFNVVLIGVSVLIIVLGFALMAGEPSGATEYNPDIFSFRRITVGPMIALAGFIALIVAILYRGRKSKNENN